MVINLRQPAGYSRIGRKDKQEDAVWPLFENATTSNRCFVLCDGVGGSLLGEVASQTCSEVIGEYLSERLDTCNDISSDDIQKAVNLAYDRLDLIDNHFNKDGCVSMSTTLTCICISKDRIYAAHMGDSRIYHIRPNSGILFQSRDHSLVNALIKVGELTPDEAKTFPQRNVITRYIQSHANKRYKADVHQLTDVKEGDYLFLCSDGVLEHLTNERLVDVLSMTCSDMDKLRLIEAESFKKTTDNYSAYLIPIDSISNDTEDAEE